MGNHLRAVDPEHHPDYGGGRHFIIRGSIRFPLREEGYPEPGAIGSGLWESPRDHAEAIGTSAQNLFEDST